MHEINKNNLGGWALGEPVINWVLENIPPASIINELGSGAGSHELGKVYKMFCVEHNPQWVGVYSNINYVFAPIVGNWYAPEALELLPANNALLIIDGPPSDIGRAGILAHLEKLNTNCPIIIDDTNRAPELALAEALHERLGRRFYTLHGIDKQSVILF